MNTNWPNNPDIDDVYVNDQGIKWKWNGKGWININLFEISEINSPTFSIFSSNTIVSGHFLPAENALYDLGTSSNQWRSLHVSGNTIYIGGVTISTNGESILMNSINFGTVEEPFILSGTSSLQINGGTFSEATITYIELEYSELYSLFDEGLLLPGANYLITDFQTCYDQPNYDSSGQPITTGNFKSGSTEQIVVFATSNNTLSSQAFSLDYPNDVLKYDITFIFTEVTNTPAKGRITERIDNFNNRTDYDMRAVEFIRYEGFYSENIYNGKVDLDSDGNVIGVGTFFLSQFTNGDIFGVKHNANTISCFQYYEVVSITDDLNMMVTGSSIQAVYNTYYSNGLQLPNYMNPHQCNVISLTGSDEYYTFPYDDDGAYNNYIGNNSDYDTFILSNNVFQDGSYRDNYFGANCVGNTFNDDCDSNTIGVGFQFNIITNDFDENTIGPDFQRNIIDCDFNRNVISEGFNRNMIGDEDGADFDDNVIGVDFIGNFITMYDDFEYNNIGFGFENNIIGDTFEENQIFGDFKTNFILNSFEDNQIGRFFYDNTIKANFDYNKIGTNFTSNTNVSNISNNLFGIDCNNNTFGTTASSGTIDGNKIGNNFDYNTILTDFTSNQISNSFNNNEIYNTFVENIIGSGANNNTFGPSDNVGIFSFGRNTIGSNMATNQFTGNSEFNTIGHYFEDNNLATNFSFNKVGNHFINNTISEDFGFGGAVSRGNTIGNYFQNNTIGEYFYDNQISDLFSGNTTGDLFQLNNISAYSVNNTDFTVNYGNIDTITYVATGTTAADDTYTGVTGSTTSTTGIDATFNIIVTGGTVSSVGLNTSGKLYSNGETITILGTSIGGATPVDDVVITVTSVSQLPVVYTSTNANIVQNSSGLYKLYYLGVSGFEFVDVTDPFD